MAEHGATHGAVPGADAHPGGHAHSGIAKYIYVFVALCVLTGASFFTYSSYWPFHDTPQIAWAFMMAVSCTKAMLVILFFMHVKYEANWKYVLTIPAGFMSIFLALMLVPDVGMRNRWASEENMLYQADPHEAAEALAAEEHPADEHDGDAAAAHDPAGEAAPHGAEHAE